jgi:hypothetical protein
MKTLFRNDYFNLKLYWTGLVVGIFYDEDDNLEIILPLFIIEIKLYNFNR